jgi:hypothetical protein
VKVLGAGFDVAVVAIDERQFVAEAENGDLNGIASLAAQMLLGGRHEALGQALALVGGIDGELTEVATLATELRVDAAEKLAGGVLCCQNVALSHHRRQTLLVGAGAFQEGFDGEGGVDKRNQARAVGCLGRADAYRRA